MSQKKTEGLVIEDLGDQDIGSLLNCSSFNYYCEMIELIQSGRCPFCELDRQKNVIKFDNGVWRAWANPYPHKHCDFHFVLAPLEHLTHVNELNGEQWRSFGEAVQYFTRFYGLDGGAIICRFGNPVKNAGSLRHLHANIQVPNGKEKVQVTIGKSDEANQKKLQVLKVWEKMRTGTSLEELTPEEREILESR